jgi:hypothetical protein
LWLQQHYVLFFIEFGGRRLNGSWCWFDRDDALKRGIRS